MPRLLLCTALNERGSECRRPVLDDAPISLCSLHILVAWKYADETMLFDHIRINESQPYTPRTREKGRRSVVYYVAFADRIKIGTTTDLAQRMGTVPHDKLLALEPGGVKRERERHQQFSAAHAHREWFNRSPELLAHIAGLVSQHGDPNALAARLQAQAQRAIVDRLRAAGLHPAQRASAEAKSAAQRASTR